MNGRMFDDENAIIEQEISERLEKKARRRTARIWLTGLVVVLAIFAAIALLVMKVFFSVEEAAVKGCTDYTVEQLMSAAGIKKGDMLFFIGKDRAAEEIKSRYLMIEDVKIEKKLPDKLIFTVKKENPLFFFESVSSEGSGKSFAVVGESQKILEIVPSKDLLKEKYGVLPEVRMPRLSYAVLGKKISYAEEGDSDYIPALLAEAKASVFGEDKLVIDASVRFDVVIYSGEAEDGGAKYEVRLGNKRRFEEKIALAHSIATEKLKADFVGLIDVSTTGDGEVKEAYARAR